MFIIIIKDQKLKKKKKKKKKMKMSKSLDFVGIAHGFWAKIVSLHFHLIFFPLIHGDI